ncbi:hypothetical protein GLOTRDRAFT_137975 [Gloeophyllum trabeum ATCC 11539]|uniref:Uncharacterized protein n=1 Tax=Gloeophyllum trabeum (strain ATCC 11539 / FP-39264 / Madison 617) TaxID=670483 RepID=S7Q9G6_GLOTA|nr:uncharacterized protein GLOTRDRAFT_137975 [Gloeophyllum trabeum ATCC 11539]EPQ56162.1 hypothetical protein GLOTRDRAFT_137975 [Gloeophyllum trabeum ATCC 11539]
MSSSTPSSTRGRPPLPSGPRLRKPPSKASLIQTEASSDSYWPHSPSPSATEPSPVLPPIYEAPCTFQPQRHTSTAEKSVQVPAPSTRKVQITPLPYPAPVDFEISPTPFKGLPLEAARWTFSSQQLQEIVSRAIRYTAQESHLRLLSLEALDVEMPREKEQLETTRFSTQAQYKFLAHRRNMLIQSLHSYAYSHHASDSEGLNTLTSLISQLSSLVGTLDKHTHTLLQATTHEHQITCLQEVHQASALAVALRKLNASYKKRTDELRQARRRIEELEAELEEAWRCAEEVALEADEDDEEELDALEPPPGESTMNSVAMAQVMGITGTAHVTKATTFNPADEKVPEDDYDSKASRRMSKVSVASTSASRSSGGRLARVRSARKRSVRASKASLRLPKTVVDDLINASGADETDERGDRSGRRRQRSRSRSRSRSRAQAPWALDTEDMPPVPRLQLDSASSHSPASAVKPQGGSFLELDNGSKNTVAPGQRTSTIEVGDMMSGRVNGNLGDNEAEQHSHPYSAPHDQSNFPPKYTEREDGRHSDPDSPIDNELRPPPRTRSRPFSQDDRSLEWDERPGPSRVFSMQAPAVAAHPTHHRASQSTSTSVSFESSIRESEPQRKSGNGVLKRGVSAPQLKRTITEYLRIGRQKRHTWGTRTARDAGGGGSSPDVA